MIEGGILRGAKSGICLSASDIAVFDGSGILRRAKSGIAAQFLRLLPPEKSAKQGRYAYTKKGRRLILFVLFLLVRSASQYVTIGIF